MRVSRLVLVNSVYLGLGYLKYPYIQRKQSESYTVGFWAPAL